MRVIIVRAGDFFGGGSRLLARSGDRQGYRASAADLSRPARRLHEWAYCRISRPRWCGSPAYATSSAPLRRSAFRATRSTGREFTTAIAKVVQNRLQVKRMGWWLIKALAPFVPLCRELAEIAYLWKEPHRIDGDKLRAAIGDVPHTPLDAAVARAIQRSCRQRLRADLWCSTSPDLTRPFTSCFFGPNITTCAR